MSSIDLKYLPAIPESPPQSNDNWVRRDKRSRNSLNHMTSSKVSKQSETWPPISKDNWVKVMVVADGPMLKYHGDKLERYILTLMQTVSSIFVYILYE